MLTANDIRIIDEIISHFGEDLTTPMLRIFGASISPAHWIKLGELKGQRTTPKTVHKFSLN